MKFNNFIKELNKSNKLGVEEKEIKKLGRIIIISMIFITALELFFLGVTIKDAEFDKIIYINLFFAMSYFLRIHIITSCVNTINDQTGPFGTILNSLHMGPARTGKNALPINREDKIINLSKLFLISFLLINTLATIILYLIFKFPYLSYLYTICYVLVTIITIKIVLYEKHNKNNKLYTLLKKGYFLFIFTMALMIIESKMLEKIIINKVFHISIIAVTLITPLLFIALKDKSNDEQNY